MIKEVSLGEVVDAPLAASFPIAWATSWTAQEGGQALATVVAYVDPDGNEGEFEAEVIENEDTGVVEVVLSVTPNTFSKEGLWGLKPAVTFGPLDVRMPAHSLALNLISKRTTRYSRTQTYRAQ